MPVCFLALSAGLTTLCGIVSDAFSLFYEKKNKCIFLICLILVSNCVMLTSHLIFRSSITQYELFLIAAVTAILLSNFFVLLYKAKRLSVDNVLKTACYVCIAVVVYSIITVGQVLIHGDTATASILTKCQIEHMSYFPKSWYYVNGDIWVFSIQSFVAPFVLMLEDQSLARSLGSALLCIVTAFIMMCHSRKKFYTNCWVIAVPLVFIFLAGQYDMILYQAAYTSQIIFLILGVSIFYNIAMFPNNWKSYAVFSAVTIISLMGGIRLLAEVIVPLCVAYALFVYFRVRFQQTVNWKNEIKDVIRVALVTAIPTIIGILLYWWLKRTHNVISSAHNMLVYVPSVHHMAENIVKYITNHFVCFGYSGHISVFSIKGIMNMVSICMCILIIFIVPVLQLTKIRNESSYVRFFTLFTFVHNLIIFVLAVCFAGKDESRYLLTSVFLCILLSTRYIYVYWISQKHFDKYIWTGLFVLALAIGMVSLLFTSKDWHSKLVYKEEVTQILQEKGLKKGYADFWTAYAHEVYSDFNVRFGGLEIYDGTPYAHFWLVDGEVFNPEDTHTFLMLSDAEHDAVQPKLSEIFQEPIEYLVINGYHFYIFDYDIAVDMI